MDGPTTGEEVKVTVADKSGLILSIFLPNSKPLYICGATFNHVIAKMNETNLGAKSNP